MNIRKILSAVLTLVMVFSTVGAIEITTFATDTVTMADFGGKVLFEENFDNPEDAGKTLAELGFTLSDASTEAVSTYNVQTAAKQDDVDNKALSYDVKVTSRAYITTKEAEEILANGNDYTIADKTKKAVVKEYGGKTYLIVNESGVKYWYGTKANQDATGYEYDAVATNTNSFWFKPDGTPWEYEEAGKTTTANKAAAQTNTTINVPKDDIKKDKDGNIIGVVTYGLKFMNPRTEAWSGDDGFTLSLGNLGVAGQYYFRESFIRVDTNHHYETYNDDVKTYLPQSSPDNTFVAKSAETVGVLDNKNDLVLFKDTMRRTGNQWHEAIVMVDYDAGIYRLYYNGKPVFFQTTSSKYISDLPLPSRKNLINPVLSAPRYNFFDGNEPKVDDIVIKYNEETANSKLKWDYISNGQSIDSVIQDLNLVNTLSLGGINYDVTWQSNAPAVISNEGVVVRGDEDIPVTLTATANGQTVVFNVVVSGKSGKNTIYLAGDSHMSNYSPSYYPQQGWGYYLSSFFSGIDVVNEAVGGQSAKSFYENFFNAKISSKLQSGDYVFISFGTNDGNTGYPTATTVEVYGEYLKKYVDDIKAKNATPVFVTLANSGKSIGIRSTYVAKMKEVASANNIACIDLNTIQNTYIKNITDLDSTTETGNAVPEIVMDDMMTYQVKENFGLTDDEILNHPNTSLRDGTDEYHFNINGAKMLARWVAKDIYNSKDSTLKALAPFVIKDTIIPTVYTAGDSLVCDWPESWFPQQGWAHYIEEYFDGAKVINTAHTGETTASFYWDEKYFPSFREDIKEGDYLLISLGTNDCSSASKDTIFVGYDGVTRKFGANITEYEANLKLFFEAVRQKGAIPVLVTFPTNGRQYNSMNEYIDKMRQLATSQEVALIDLRKANLNYIDQTQSGISTGEPIPEAVVNEMYMMKDTLMNTFGFTEAEVIAHPNYSFRQGNNDATHFNVNGAQRLANMFATELYNSNDTDLVILKDALKDSAFAKDAEAVNILSAEMSFDGTNTIISGKISRKLGQLVNKAFVVAGVFNGKKLEKSGVEFVNLTSLGNEDFSCTIEGEVPTGCKVMLFIWDSTNFMPLCSVSTLAYVGLDATQKANGVILSWNAIDGAAAYDVYRDGNKIATVDETTYTDKLFTTIDQLESDESLCKSEHIYSIGSGDLISEGITAGADTSLIKYISFDDLQTSPSRIGQQTQSVQTSAALNEKANGITTHSALSDNGGHILDNEYFFVSNKDVLTTPATYTTYKTRYASPNTANFMFMADNTGLLMTSAVQIPSNELTSAISGGLGTTKDNAIGIASDKQYARYTTMEPFAIVDAFDDETIREYLVITTLKANNTIDAQFIQFPVKNDFNNHLHSSVESEATSAASRDDGGVNIDNGSGFNAVTQSVPYKNGVNQIISVYDPQSGVSNTSYKVTKDRVFAATAENVGEFKTYMFDINAYLGSKLVNLNVNNIYNGGKTAEANIRFKTGTTTDFVVRNLGIVKPEDFIK